MYSKHHFGVLNNGRNQSCAISKPVWKMGKYNQEGQHMSVLEDAVERIKILECPTGDLEQRVKGILEEYGVANGNDLMVSRDERFDQKEAQAYSATISGDQQSILILAKSGLDDYVAQVVDVYIRM